MTARRAPWWWLVIPGLAVLELASYLLFARRAPSESEWREIVTVVDELRRGGELILIAPRWAEPLARSVLGDRRLPVADLARADESAYHRAIEVGILGHTAPELDTWRVRREEQRGRFHFRVLDNPRPESPRFVFTDQLAPPTASVFDVLDGEPIACSYNPRARVSAGTLPGPPAFPAQRFECRGGGGFFAGVTLIDDQDYRPRRCIWAGPPQNGSRLIEYAGVPLGRRIQGYAGSPRLMTRDGQGSVKVEVRVDGRSIGAFSHVDHEGWKHFSLPTGAEGQLARVSFEIVGDRTPDRQLCFHADTR